MTNVIPGRWTVSDDPGSQVADAPEHAYDEPMTDLTRQQVTDLLAASEAKVGERLANFDSSLKTGFSEIATAMAKQAAAIEKQTDSMRVEMAQMRTEFAKQTGALQTEMANTRTDTQKATNEVTRWVVGFGVTILGTILAMAGAFMTFSKLSDKPSGGLPAAPAPIIITVPVQQPAVAPAAITSPAVKGN